MPTQTNFQRWDIKFYYWIHCNKQKANGNNPTTYSAFSKRLKQMTLHDAIYSPRVESQVRRNLKHYPTSEDNYRRRMKLNEENIQILDLDEIPMKELKTKWKNRIVFKPKPTLRDRFLNLFKN